MKGDVFSWRSLWVFFSPPAPPSRTQARLHQADKHSLRATIQPRSVIFKVLRNQTLMRCTAQPCDWESLPI